MRDTIRNKYACRLIANKYKSYVQAHILSLAVALVLLLLPPLYAQSEVQGNSSTTFQNEKLSAVLLKLSETEDLNFSYDANDPVYDKRISYSSKGESIQKILDNILSEAGLTHKQIGKQTVIYHSEDDQLNPVIVAPVIQSENSQNNVIVLNESPVSITEYKIDTIYLQDTLFRIDTIRVVDTVFIEKEKPEKPATAKIKEIPVDFFQPGVERDKGWAMGIFAAPILDDFSLVKDQKSFSLRSFSLGVDAVKLLKRWNITFGLRLTQFNHRFTQQYSINEGGFFDTDTIDAYYTVIETDTAWYYVTDSSWVPLEQREYSYEKTNTLGYLECNVSASFDLYKSPKMRIYVKAGGQLSLLIYNNGIAFPGDDQAEGVDFEELQFNEINYAFSLGTGLKYKIADKVDFNTELYYSGYLNTLVPEFPVDTKIKALGLKLGLVFYF